MNIFLSTWVLLVSGLVFALPMIHLRVKEHTDVEDETLLVCRLVSYQSPIDPFASTRMDDSGKIALPEKAST
jgi:hypothetical protein